MARTQTGRVFGATSSLDVDGRGLSLAQEVADTDKLKNGRSVNQGSFSNESNVDFRSTHVTVSGFPRDHTLHSKHAPFLVN